MLTKPKAPFAINSPSGLFFYAENYQRRVI